MCSLMSVLGIQVTFSKKRTKITPETHIQKIEILNFQTRSVKSQWIRSLFLFKKVYHLNLITLRNPFHRKNSRISNFWIRLQIGQFNTTWSNSKTILIFDVITFLLMKMDNFYNVLQLYSIFLLKDFEVLFKMMDNLRMVIFSCKGKRRSTILISWVFVF